jgi:hypothetical protein
MAYDEQLATRVRTLLKGQKAIVEKKMFGGACLSVARKDVRRNPERRSGRAGGAGGQRCSVEEASHKTDGLHGAPNEGLHLCEPRRCEDCGAIAPVARAGTAVC